MNLHNLLKAVLLFSICSSALAVDNQNTNLKGRSPFKVDNMQTQSLTVKPLMPRPLVKEEQKKEVIDYLTLNQGKLLSQEIESWAQLNGLNPLWNSNKDYIIYNTINISGKNKDDILMQLGNIFSSEHYGLVIKLYEKNNVLVIDAQ